MSDIFTATICDRCGKRLGPARIMSMYNTDIICMDCKEKESKRPDYKKAVEADNEQIRIGNYNFGGIGYKEVDA